MILKRVLIIGALDTAAQRYVDDLSHNQQFQLTVYTPSRVRLAESIQALTEEILDEGGLTAAMLDQDVVVALVPTIRLTAMVKTLVTAANATGTRSLMISRTDDIDDLPGEIRMARQQLAQAQLHYDFITGLGGIGTLLGSTPVPSEVISFDPLTGQQAG